ncbi:putative transcription factor C2H2 family [Rosa chinensis]|uniref:Putative transcription factor C2H2 family n=1 Tax=Rosa chinensis TaxID=74649 RepID=A0A2P6SIW4_ROSCH|nr:putative transcription factor C2H2 family [Rosa chinensis]
MFSLKLSFPNSSLITVARNLVILKSLYWRCLACMASRKRNLDTTKSIALNMLKIGLLMVMCLGVECCVCDCLLDNSSSSSISIFNSGHATHLQCEVSEHDTSSSISSSGCPVCISEKKSHRQHLKECSSRPQHTRQSASNHHESNASENNGLQQILRV